MKKIILIVGLLFLVISNTAFAEDHTDTIKRVGIMAQPGLTYFTLYILTDSNKEYSYRSNLHQNGIDVLKAMEAQAIYAKASGSTVLLRTTGEVISGHNILWGLLVTE